MRNAPDIFAVSDTKSTNNIVRWKINFVMKIELKKRSYPNRVTPDILNFPCFIFNDHVTRYKILITFSLLSSYGKIDAKNTFLLLKITRAKLISWIMKVSETYYKQLVGISLRPNQINKIKWRKRNIILFFRKSRYFHVLKRRLVSKAIEAEKSFSIRS